MSKAFALSSSSPEYKGIAGLNIIYEAGLDRESRPVLILCADNLPNPDIYDYDLILSFILARLDEFVENDYVLVFFSSPARYRPGWLWLLRAYRSLDRKLIFDLANKIVSLEELKQYVELAAQFIPQRVVDYDQQLPTTYSSYFSMLQQRQLSASSPSLAFGLDKEGIFRKSPASDELQAVKNAFNKGEAVNLNQYDIDVSAALFKVFIRELPTPLISLKLSENMGALPDASICTKGTIDKIRNKLLEQYKDTPNYLYLLNYVCKFLKEVSDNSNKNRMNTHNLSVVFTPNMIRADESLKNVHETEQSALADAAIYLKQMEQGMQLVRLLIAKHEDIFQ
ncbi:Rho GTPase-activating protein 1 [Choanephora cucurbitarum]|uniref:Rho GTPase-activating protein 1 n=1 Tax=Choanephora cucurbitarum TaxID=101091 RepID=A0A1C7N419_9FUNG|nr:Rho GTPase-activating protein 1 [Choanephora cucurbitarum]